MSDVRDFLDSYQAVLANEINTEEWPPEIISLYAFESCLKHTPGREVYLVVDKRTGGKAVMRVTAHDAGNSADAEWAILSQLDHPGIPRTFGRLATGGKSYIVREFIPGQALDTVVARGVLAPQDAFGVAKKLCSILAYLHGRNPPIIHRDIKPQNIILKPDGSMVLTDFGIARTFKQGADSDTHYAGTLPYAPPEQYGYAQSTAQTDIYALGILLVYLVTGSPDRQNLPEKIKNKRLLTLIQRCIAFDPADRFASVEEVLRSINDKRLFRVKLAGGIAGGLVAFCLIGFGVFALLNVFALPAQSNAPESEQGSDDLEAGSANEPDGSQEADNAIPHGSAPIDADGQLFDSTATGNLTGNIGNGGIAVEGGGETFVALKEGIFVLNDDGTLGRKAVAARDARYLNYYNGALYFSGNPGVVKADPTTGETTVLVDAYCQKVFISDNALYFENGEDSLNLYSIDLDSGSKTQVSALGSVYYRNVVGDYEYFSNTDDGELLYRQNLVTGKLEMLYDTRSAWISVYGSTIYFSDFSIPGKMMRMDLDGSNAEELYLGSYSFVNATPIGVFFTNPEGQQLEVMTLDGASRTVLVDKKCSNFYVTSQWIVYENREDDDNLWIVRLDGSDDRPMPTE